MIKAPGDDLLLRYLEGRCSQGEQMQVEEWLLTGRSNADTFELFALKHSCPVSINKRSVRKGVLGKIGEMPGQTAGQPSFSERDFYYPKLLQKRKRLQQWLPAAAVILIAAAGGIFAHFWKADTPETEQIVFIEHTAPAGTSKTITLRDGSNVQLNAESTLRFSENFGVDTDVREVFLEGEAFFEVTNTGDRPFIVHSGQLQTTVLGTAFNVKAYPDDDWVQVSVAEGKVSVKQQSEGDSSKLVMLEPNQWATYRYTSKEMIKEQGDVREFLAWKDGILLFHDKTVAQVTTMLERWYDITIRVEKDDVKNCLIHGEYQDKSLETVLRMMQFTLDIHYEFKEEGVSITGGRCQ